MRSVIWVCFWPMFASFVFSYAFYLLRDEAVEPPGMVPSGRHIRVRVGKNQPEQAPGWFGSKPRWLLLFLTLMVILKFGGGGDNSNVCTPHSHLFGSPGGKTIKAYPCKDSMCGALTRLEMELVNLVSSVRSLKLTAATGGNRQHPNIEVLSDAENNMMIYEIWEAKDPYGVDLPIREKEE